MLGDQVTPEFLQCQVEVGTPVCDDLGEARDHLANQEVRRTDWRRLKSAQHSAGLEANQAEHNSEDAALHDCHCGYARNEEPTESFAFPFNR